MSAENDYRMLEVLGRNPRQSAEKARQNVICMKKEYSEAKGVTAETIIAFLIKIPKVIDVKPLHEFFGDLDADLICEIEDIEPVYIQVKTSETDAEKYRGKIRRRMERGLNPRFVALSFDTPFDEIIKDFADQVNKIEGRIILRPIKFTNQKATKKGKL